MYKFFAEVVENFQKKSRHDSAAEEARSSANNASTTHEGSDVRAASASPKTRINDSAAEKLRIEKEKKELRQFLENSSLGNIISSQLESVSSPTSSFSSKEGLKNVVDGDVEFSIYEYYYAGFSNTERKLLDFGCDTSALRTSTSEGEDDIVPFWALRKPQFRIAKVEKETVEIPIHLISVLLNRWMKVCRQGNFSRLLYFLCYALPGWVTLADLLGEKFRNLMKDDVTERFDECCCVSVNLLVRKLLGRVVSSEVDTLEASFNSPATPSSSSPLPSSFVTPSEECVVNVFRKLIHLMMLTYLPPSSDASRASGESNGDLLRGKGKMFSQLKQLRRGNESSSSTRPFSPLSPPRESQVLLSSSTEYSMKRTKPISSLKLSSAPFGEWQESISSEFAPLLILFCGTQNTREEEKEILATPSMESGGNTADELVFNIAKIEPNVRYEIVVCLLQLQRILPFTAQKCEWFGNMVMSILNLLVGKLQLTAPDKPTLDAVLPPISAGIVLIADLLLRDPSVIGPAMINAGFLDSLVSVLEKVGMVYKDEAESHVEGYRLGKSLYEQLTSLSNSKVVEEFHEASPEFVASSSAFWEEQAPLMLACANDDCADEFLHAFLGLLSCGREARGIVNRNAQVVSYLDQLQEVIFRVVLNDGEKNGGCKFGKQSALYSVLLKHAICAFPNSDASALESRGEAAYLDRFFSSGLCNIFFGNTPYFEAFCDGSIRSYNVMYILYKVLMSCKRLNASQQDKSTMPLDFTHETLKCIFSRFGDTIRESSGENRKESDVKIEKNRQQFAGFLSVLVTFMQSPFSEKLAHECVELKIIPNCLKYVTEKSLKSKDARKETEDPITQTGRLVPWLVCFLSRLLRAHEAQVQILENEDWNKIFLLCECYGECSFHGCKLLSSLLTYNCSDFGEYQKKLSNPIARYWKIIDNCVGISADMESIESLRPQEKDIFLIFLLQCLRAATDVLRGSPNSSTGLSQCQWAPLRQFQTLVRYGLNNEEYFVRIFHRLSLTWESGTTAAIGTRELVFSLVCLIKGNPAARAQIFAHVKPQELVRLLKSSSVSRTVSKNNWKDFVVNVLLLSCEVLEEKLDNDQDIICNSIQNPQLVVALLNAFPTTNLEPCHLDALGVVLKVVLRVVNKCRSSMYLLCKWGLWESLCHFIPVVCNDKLLRSMVYSLLIICASHQIEVRQLKHMLLMLISESSIDQRKLLLSSVLKILGSSALTCTSAQTYNPKSFITNRNESGLVGIKAVLHEFPTEGYTVSMWIRLEEVVLVNKKFCLYSFQSIEQNSVLSVFINLAESRVELHYNNADSPNFKYVEIQLDTSEIKVNHWTHIAVVHRPSMASFLHSGNKMFYFYIDGVERNYSVTTPVLYPTMSRGYFYIGIDGACVKQYSTLYALPGQMTTIYFFAHHLSSKKIKNIYCMNQKENNHNSATIPSTTAGSSSHTGASAIAGAPSSSLGTGSTVTETASTMLKGDVGVERHLADEAYVCVDPRLNEKGQLYNLSALLCGRGRESRLVVYEGTLVCDTTTVMDAMCAAGPLTTVLLPLMLLVGNANAIPFTSEKSYEFDKTNCVATMVSSASLDEDSVHSESINNNGDSNKSTTTNSGFKGEETLKNLFQMISSLAELPFVRDKMNESGVFVLFAQLLEKCGPNLSVRIPEQVAKLCSLVTPFPSIFEAVYSSFFLSPELLHSFSHETRVAAFRAQMNLALSDKEAASQMRLLGAQLFTVSEILEDINSMNPEKIECREVLLEFLEILTMEPVMMNDTVAIVHLIHRLFIDCDVEPILLTVLCHIRLLIFARPIQFAQLLGRKDYAVSMISFFRESEFSAVRNEAILQFLLLTTRSKRTQELMNMKMLSSKDVVHVTHNTTLAWMKDTLQPYPVSTSLYMALRDGLTGQFDRPVLSETYEPLTSNAHIVFYPSLTPMLLLMKRSTDDELKLKFVLDLKQLLSRDKFGWRQLISLQGWYVHMIHLYESVSDYESIGVEFWTSHRVLTLAELASVRSKGSSSNEALLTRSTDDVLPEPKHVRDKIFMAITEIMSETLFKVLTHESYGHAETRSFVAYMLRIRSLPVLTQVLSLIVDRYSAKIAKNGKSDGFVYHLGAGNRVAFFNLICLINLVEDVVFYSLPPEGISETELNPNSEHSSPEQKSNFSPKPIKTSYNEWDELVVTAVSGVKNKEGGKTRFHYIYGTDEARGEGKILLERSPDGRWLHLALALKIADLITTNKELLNFEGTSPGSMQSDLFVFPAVAAVNVLGGVSANIRRGGLRRIFARMIRVSSAFTLKRKTVLDSIVVLLERFVRLVETGKQGNALSVLMRRNVSEVKEHSSPAITMLLFYTIHTLLLKRLRLNEGGDTDRYANVNASLVETLKSLTILHKRVFDHGNFSDAYQVSYADCTVKICTLKWLTTHGNGGFRSKNSESNNSFSFSSPALQETSVNDKNVVEFAEVASRVDYNNFVEKCGSILGKEMNTDNALYSVVQTERNEDLAHLQKMLAEFNLSRQTVNEKLRNLEQGQLSVYKAKESTENTSVDTFSDFFQPQTTSRMTAALRASAWLHFISSTKGTIWNAEFDENGNHIVNSNDAFVCLRQCQQGLLVHRKLGPYPNGSNHSNVPVKNKGSENIDGDNSDKLGEGAQRDKNPLRLKGGEEVFLDERVDLDEDLALEEENLAADHVSLLDAGEEQTGLVPLSSTEHQSVSPQNKDQHRTDEGDEDAANRPTLLSVLCEVPYMMHCWSAKFTVRGTEVAVSFDEVNTAYNQSIAEEAKAFLIPPKSFSFNIGQLFYIVPGRRFRMKRTAIEVWLRNNRNYFFNFHEVQVMRSVTQILCQTLYRSVPAFGFSFLQHDHRNVFSASKAYLFQENIKKEPLRLIFMNLWQNREMSNFDYLLFLNVLAGRTTCDLTQYPVFPWILSNYTSEELDLNNPQNFRDLTKPIGVCGEENRSTMVKQRYEEMKEMGDVPSHYFTHYSSAAVTLYYLMRLEPYTSLSILLQGGQFDHADRMFHSVASTFRNVITSSQDVREMIPELYYLPEMCFNSNRVFFGKRQDGSTVANLQLPPWAHNNPYEFIYRMREALESDYVSSMLHHWIDLIFGYKQRGKEAIEALNVFNWHSYEELDTKKGNDVDPNLLVDSLDNIGQTPIQLFRHPHNSRHPNDIVSPLLLNTSIKRTTLQLGLSRISFVGLVGSNRIVLVGGNGATFSTFVQLSSIRQPYVGPSNAITSPGNTSSKLFTSPLGATPPSATRSPAHQAADTVSNRSLPLPMEALPHSLMNYYGAYEAVSFDLREEYERRIPAIPPGIIPNTTSFGDGPVLSNNVSLLCFDSHVFVVMGGLFDHSVIIRPLSNNASDVRLCAHRGKVTCIATSSNSQHMVTGSEDTTFVIWSCAFSSGGMGVLTVQPVFTIYGHEDVPTAVAISASLDFVVTASVDGVMMVHSVGDGKLERVVRHPHNYPIHRILVQSMCYVPNILYASDKDNIIYQMSVNGENLRSFPAPGPITCWCTTPHQFLLISCASNKYKPEGLSNANNNTRAGSNESTEEKKTENNGPSVMYLHSFFLSAEKTVPTSLESSIEVLACHASNPQVVVGGTSNGELVLLRSCRQQSSY